MATDQKDQSLIHREMARKANDVHRVRNIRNEDYRLVWDGYVDIIPANGTIDFETYKVDKYLREMTDLILRERQDQAVKEENKKRASRGEKQMDKWAGEAQHTMEGNFALTEGVGSPEARLKVYQELYVGLVKEYGVEKIQKQTNDVIPSTHEQLMGQLLGKRVFADDVDNSKAPIESNVPTTPLEMLKQPQLIKKAKEMGIPTQKTDKKQELIDKISQQNG